MEGIIISIGLSWLLYHIGDFIEILNMILKDKRKIILIPKIILSCLKCTTFWVALFVTGSLGTAGCLSIVAFLFDKYLFNTDIRL